MERRQLHGPDTFTLNEDQFYGRSIPAWRRNSPFLHTVAGKLEEVGAAGGVSAYWQLFGNVDDDDEPEPDTFSDAEEDAEADGRLQELNTFSDAEEEERLQGLSGELDLDDDLLIEPTSGASWHGGRGKWSLSMPGKETEADSGGRVLAAFLRQLHDHDPERFERVRAADIRGRTRLLMADDREKIYTGRPDLAEHTIEFSPGWWVGTNYSTPDVLRLPQAATRAVGWTWNIDVHLRIWGHAPDKGPALGEMKREALDGSMGAGKATRFKGKDCRMGRWPALT